MKMTEKKKESQVHCQEKTLDNFSVHLSDCHIADSSSVSSLTVSDTDLTSAKKREKKKKKNLRLSENREEDEREVKHSFEHDSDVVMSDDHDL